jgi:hypothetical protein
MERTTPPAAMGAAIERTKDMTTTTGPQYLIARALKDSRIASVLREIYRLAARVKEPS